MPWRIRNIVDRFIVICHIMLTNTIESLVAAGNNSAEGIESAIASHHELRFIWMDIGDGRLLCKIFKL